MSKQSEKQIFRNRLTFRHSTFLLDHRFVMQIKKRERKRGREGGRERGREREGGKEREIFE